MNQRQGAKSTSPSRLSPSAKPFTFNPRYNRQNPIDSTVNASIETFIGLDSFASRSLDDDSVNGSFLTAYGYYADEFDFPAPATLAYDRLHQPQYLEYPASCHDDSNSFAMFTGQSDSVTGCSYGNLLKQDNAGFVSNPAVNNYGNSDSYKQSGTKKPHVMLSASANEKETLQSSLVNSDLMRKDNKPVSDMEYSSVVDNAELKIALSNFLDDVTSQLHCVAVSNSMGSSSTEDLDSPCWKGLASYKSPVEVSQPASSEFLKNEQEASTRLNPLASDFFPSHVKGNMHENGSVGSGSLPLQQSGYLAVKLFSTEWMPDSLNTKGACPSEVNDTIGTSSSGKCCGEKLDSAVFENTKFVPLFSSGPPEVNNTLGNLCSGNNIGEKQDNSRFNNSKGSNLVYFHPPSVLEDLMTSYGKFDIKANLAVFTNSYNDAADSVLAHSSSCTTEPATSLSSSEVGVTYGISEIPQGVSDSLFAPPEIEVRNLVYTMHSLSELLVQNSSKGFDSFNDHELDVIRHITNNLHVCMRKKKR